MVFILNYHGTDGNINNITLSISFELGLNHCGHEFTLCNSTRSFLCGPQSQLDAMKLNRLHAATMAPTPSHIRTREEKGEAWPHQRARRASSDDNSRPKSANRITTIPEITESFERRLCLRDKMTMSLVRKSVIKF